MEKCNFAFSNNCIFYQEKFTGQSFNNDDEEEEGDDAPSLNSTQVDKRQMLIFDPDLPLGWKRIINTNASTGKPQVNIIRYLFMQYLYKIIDTPCSIGSVF